MTDSSADPLVRDLGMYVIRNSQRYLNPLFSTLTNMEFTLGYVRLSCSQGQIARNRMSTMPVELLICQTHHRRHHQAPNVGPHWAIWRTSPCMRCSLVLRSLLPF